jgi:hypothetical protein
MTARSISFSSLGWMFASPPKGGLRHFYGSKSAGVSMPRVFAVPCAAS